MRTLLGLLNTVLHSNTPLFSKALFPYHAGSLRQISVPLINDQFLLFSGAKETGSGHVNSAVTIIPLPLRVKCFTLTL